MILKDFLLQLDNRQLVCIGSKSNYVYFGQPDNIDEIEAVSNWCISWAHKRKTRLKRELVNAEAESNIKRIKTQLKEADKYINSFVPMLQREVVADYMQEASDYAHVILIEGLEIGRYWLKKEYDLHQFDIMAQL